MRISSRRCRDSSDEARRAAGMALTATIVVAGPPPRLTEAAKALSELKDVGVRAVLISYGDNPAPAVRVSRQTVVARRAAARVSEQRGRGAAALEPADARLVARRQRSTPRRARGACRIARARCRGTAGGLGVGRESGPAHGGQRSALDTAHTLARADGVTSSTSGSARRRLRFPHAADRRVRSSRRPALRRLARIGPRVA